MLRLNPEGYLRFAQADRFEVSYGGGEANAAVSLANYGDEASFVTKLPDNPLGQCAVNALRRYGVDVSDVVRGGPRLGILLPRKGRVPARQQGALRPRRLPSIALAGRGDFDWDAILDGADLVPLHRHHPRRLVGEPCPRSAMDALQGGEGEGTSPSAATSTIAGKLWSASATRARSWVRLMPYVDVCIANEEDAKDGVRHLRRPIPTSSARRNSTKRRLHRRGAPAEGAASSASRHVAVTLRTSLSASDNRLERPCSTTGDTVLLRPGHTPSTSCDRVGGGDSFGGGADSHAAARTTNPPSSCIEFAVAASCLKQTIEQRLQHASP